MKRANFFCIYRENNTCLLKKISLDIQGNCQACIYISLSREELEQARKQGRHSLP